MSILERLQFQQRQRTVTPAASRASIFDPDGPAIGGGRPNKQAAARFSLEDDLQVSQPARLS